MPNGQIVKALSGYYYVHSETITWQCRARGLFKKLGIHPVVGDFVEVEPTSNNEGTVVHVHERHNELIRPPIANVDQVLLLFSITQPAFNPFLLDKFLVHIEHAHIPVHIVITKCDLLDDPYRAYPELGTYEQIGYDCMLCSVETGQGLEQVAQALTSKTTVLAGQSGVGKSSLLNAIEPQLGLETGIISTKIGRGKHTTRHVELIAISNGGRVADTPGFSQLDFHNMEMESLRECYVEFKERNSRCKFRGCLHYKEPQCAIKEAVSHKEISQHRYNSYIQMLENLTEQKQRKRY